MMPEAWERVQDEWSVWVDIDVSSWTPTADADFSLANYPESNVGARGAFPVSRESKKLVWCAVFLDSDGGPAIPGTNDQTFSLQLYERVNATTLAAGAVLETGAAARNVYEPVDSGAGRFVPRVTAVAGTDPSLPTLRILVREH